MDGDTAAERGKRGADAAEGALAQGGELGPGEPGRELEGRHRAAVPRNEEERAGGPLPRAEAERSGEQRVRRSPHLGDTPLHVCYFTEVSLTLVLVLLYLSITYLSTLIPCFEQMQDSSKKNRERRCNDLEG